MPESPSATPPDPDSSDPHSPDSHSPGTSPSGTHSSGLGSPGSGSPSSGSPNPHTPNLHTHSPRSPGSRSSIPRRPDAKTIVVTGASDGIGAAAARLLHEAGHRVAVVGRSPRKTEAVADALGVDWFVADFMRLDDVRQLALDLDKAYPRIDVLINNAGGVFGHRTVSEDGFEKTFQVNYLASYLLTRLLLDKLIASSGTVTMTSSSGARQARALDLDDLSNERNYEPARAYAFAKLEDILFAKELHRRYHDHGLSAAAIDPGIVATNFANDTTNPIIRFVKLLGRSRTLRSIIAIPPDQGADQLVWLATTFPDNDWQSGGFYVKRKPDPKINPQALNAALAEALWDRTEKLLGL